MRPVSRDSILDYVTYEQRREELRPSVLREKKRRRVHVGEHLTFLFENAETMRYHMPSYEKDGTVEIAFASNKRHIAFYLLKEPVLDRYRGHFPKSRIGKGCVRFSSPKQLDLALIERMIQDAFESDAPIC